MADRSIASSLEKAKKILSEHEFESLEFHSDRERQLEHFIEASELDDETPIKGDLPNFRLLLEKPDSWWKATKAFLFSKNELLEEKTKLIWFIRFNSELSKPAIPILKKIVVGEYHEELRRQSILALAEIDSSNCKSLLVRHAESNSEPDEFRSACVHGLANALDEKTRDMLLGFWRSETESEELRRASIRVLANDDLEEFIEELIEIGGDERKSGEIRRTCLWLLDESLQNEEVKTLFTSLIRNDGGELSSIASKAFLDFVCGETSVWDEELIDLAARTVMNIKSPCVHFLDTLRQLATTRFMRNVSDSATIIRTALSSLEPEIEIAFVFGSTARNEQDAESDIDLFLIGSITLKDLSKPLREAEERLGRDVNPVIYKSRTFIEKFQKGDPFLADVVNREKKVVFPNGKDSEEVKRELRAMAQSEPMASTE